MDNEIILNEFSDFNFGFQRLSFFLSIDLFEYETESSQAQKAGLLSGQIVWTPSYFNNNFFANLHYIVTKQYMLKNSAGIRLK